MSIAQEFRTFIARGNVVDLAVGVIIGGAFGKIVDELVNKIIMPPIGLAIGGVDFGAIKTVLKPAEGDVAEVAIQWGSFINSVITFLIIAMVIFLLVKGINRLRAPAAEAPPADPGPTLDQQLLTEIRDLLKK
jgi:large conductance mechanosensitive channel